MATALGIGIVENVVSDSFSAAINNPLYTVPSGRYAYINMHEVNSGTIQIQDASSSALSNITTAQDFFLHSGGSLVAIGGPANFGGTIIEYKNP